MSGQAGKRHRLDLLYARSPRCYWCGRPVRRVPVPEGEPQPPDLATLDDLAHRSRYPDGRPQTWGAETTVLACHECNEDRGHAEALGQAWVPPVRQLTASQRRSRLRRLRELQIPLPAGGYDGIMGMTAVPKGEIVVDSRGRTTLARVRSKVFDRYRATEHEDGTIVLTPLVTLTPAELVQVRQA